MEFQQYPITLIIIIITVLISINAFNDMERKRKWIFYPYRVNYNKEYYRFITHILIHADGMHLAFNMFVLFSFGGLLEQVFVQEFGLLLGSFHFLFLYLVGGIFAATFPYIKNQDNIHYLSLGASGAVSAVLFASIIWLPHGGIYILFIPFEIKAWLFGFLYLGFEYYMSKRGNTGVAHDAHFGGAVFGILYVLIIASYKGQEFINYIIS